MDGKVAAERADPTRLAPSRVVFMEKRNAVGWFEIPVVDMERAMRFYEAVFGHKLERHTLGPLDMAWFPRVEGGEGAAGALVRMPGAYTPSKDAGVLIYFTTPSGDVAEDLRRVEKAGGEVLMPKKMISPEYGHMGLALDSEGNRVAFHSRK